jgi:hypothetical protein
MGKAGVGAARPRLDPQAAVPLVSDISASRRHGPADVSVIRCAWQESECLDVGGTYDGKVPPVECGDFACAESFNGGDNASVGTARRLIPELEGLSPMEASDLVHAESSYLAKRLARRAMDDGKNIIWDATMSSTTTTEQRLDDLGRAGYSTSGVLWTSVSPRRCGVPTPGTAKGRTTGRASGSAADTCPDYQASDGGSAGGSSPGAASLMVSSSGWSSAGRALASARTARSSSGRSSSTIACKIA